MSYPTWHALSYEFWAWLLADGVDWLFMAALICFAVSFLQAALRRGK